MRFVMKYLAYFAKTSAHTVAQTPYSRDQRSCFRNIILEEDEEEEEEEEEELFLENMTKCIRTQ